MPFPTTKELKRAIEDILSSTQDEGRLSQLTVRIVRRELTTRFSLKQDALEAEEYKSFVKETVHATLEKFQNAPEVDREVNERSPKRKAGASGVAKAGALKHVVKARVHSSDEEAPKEADLSDSEAQSSKKSSARSKGSKPAKSTKTAKKLGSETKHKSKETIESSDEEGAPESGPRMSVRSSNVSAKRSPPKYKRKQKQREADKDDSDVEMSTAKGPDLSGSSSKPKQMIKSPESLTSKPKEPTKDPMESELSSVIDEPPKKRQKKQEKMSVKPQKEKTKRGKKEALSKDDETINKLKSIVVACGVRKVWKKEFEGLDKPSQQIKRLHSLLGELGMTPRYSLEKAKAIREQRELAQELKDVQDFERATSRRGKGVHTSPDSREPTDQSGSEVDAPAQKKHNAQESIMAFLQDQSEEE